MNSRYIAAGLLAFAAACQEPAAERKAADSSAPASTAATTTSSSRKLEETNGMGSASAIAAPSATASSESSAEFGPELSGRGGLWGEEDPRAALVPRIRMAATSVNGRLPPEVIQRIVRQNFGKLRLCYEASLVRNPLLFGRVATAFTIDASGATKDAKTTSDVITDKELLGCMQRSFLTLSFPAPEAGMVKVVYPVVLAAPEYTFTIDGKPSSTVREEDVVKTLEAAGYKVTGAATASQPTTTVSRFKAEKGDVTFSITLDPTARLPVETYKKLEKEAVLLQDGAWCLFVESRDKTASQALLDAIHKKLPRE